MKEKNNLKIYTASAGSGKTHTMVCKYLSLTLENNKAFAHILAVTFTNKAAREMKHRILDTIHNIANSRYDAIAHELLTLKSWSQSELTNRAKLLLSSILHNYSQFAICTIDSFLQKVITSCDTALGLYSAFDLELNTKKAIDYATRKTMENIIPNKSLKKWTLQLAEDKLYQEKNWDPTLDISALCSTLFAESQKLCAKRIDIASIEAFLESLNITISHFKTKLQGYGLQAITTIQSKGLKTEDFAYGKSGVMGYLENLANLKIDDPTKRTIAALDNRNAWYSKKSQNIETITNLVESNLIHLLQDVLFYYGKNALPYKSAKVVKQYLYMLGIKSQLECSLQSYREKNNTIFISDAALLAHNAVSTYGAEVVMNRLGHCYNSIFIDEFQDISSLQWSCFKPLIMNGVAKNCSSIVVGDIKQSIYRWRNSDWRLLHSQIFSDIDNHSTMQLYTNWRSRPNIVLFNNTFFSLASSLLKEQLMLVIGQIEDDVQLRGSLHAQAYSIADIYSSVTQSVAPLQDLSKTGYVRIQFFNQQEDPNSPSWQELSIQQTVDSIEALQKDGFEPKEIAIIVRNHKEGNQILEAIIDRGANASANPECTYEAVSSASFCLAHNKWINLIISAMKYMANKKDKLCEYELRFFYSLCLKEKIPSPAMPHCHSRENGNPVNQTSHCHSRENGNPVNQTSHCHSRENGNPVNQTSHCHSRENGNPVAQNIPLSIEEYSYFTRFPFSRENQRDTEMTRCNLFDIAPEELKKIATLRHLPITAILEELIELFEIANDKSTPFLQKFGDLVLEFSKKEASLDAFIEWWEHTGNLEVLPGAEGMNAIKILTIHQSKGLQFDAVIVPFCSWAFDHTATHAPLLWCNDSSSTDLFSGMPALPILYSPKLKTTVFSKFYYEEQIQTYLDNLNLLYVALTRSKDRLYIFSKKPSTDGIKSVADLLYTILRQGSLPKGDYFLTSWQSFWNSNDDDVLEIGTRVSRNRPSGAVSVCVPSPILSNRVNPSGTPAACHSCENENPVRQTSHCHSRENENPVRQNIPLSIEEEVCLTRSPVARRRHERNWLSVFEKLDTAIDAEKAKFGNTIHDLLSGITTLQEMSGAINGIDFLSTNQEARIYIKRTLEALIRDEQIKNWFGGDWEHKVESTVVTSIGKILRPDRVLLQENRAIVIDFKTGGIALPHKKQLQEYAAAIVDMGYSSVEGYLVYLCDVVSVVPVF